MTMCAAMFKYSIFVRHIWETCLADGGLRTVVRPAELECSWPALLSSTEGAIRQEQKGLEWAFSSGLVSYQ